MASDSTILGAAGEHYVMRQLLRRGMIAALAPTGVPNADIVVTNQVGDRLCAVQVKARRTTGKNGGWPMRPKHEELSCQLRRLWTCLYRGGCDGNWRPVDQAGFTLAKWYSRAID
jgi:hypothetical protein